MNKSLKVLHVITEMGVGGAESVVVEMVQGGSQVGWQSAVASGGGQRADTLKSEGHEQFFIPLPRRSARGLLAARSSAATAISTYKPDAIIAHNVSATTVTRLSQRGTPVLSIFHGVADSDYRNAARILSFASNHIVTVSNAIAGRLQAAAGGRKLPITVIHNAITDMPRPDRAAAREEFGIAPDVPMALCVARMEPQKRHDVLLDAWAKLSGDELLILAANGSLRPALEAQAERLGLGPRVRFFGSGERSDIPKLFAACDISVLTSDWEGLPISILESLSAHRPVVATDVDGLREILGTGGGRLVPPQNTDAIADAFREMLYDHDARAREADLGVETIRSRYNPALMMESYDDLLRSLIRH